MAFEENHVTLTGNLTRDPQVTYTASSLAIMKFGIAVNNRKKQGDQWVDDPCFVDITVFGTRAEQLADLLSKGKPVSVSGRLQYRSWETDGGGKQSKLEVIGDVVKPLVKETFGKGKDGQSDDDDPVVRNNQGRQVRKTAQPDDGAVPF